MAERTYQDILDEIAGVKEARMERLRELLPNPEEVENERELRKQTIKAQNHDDIIEFNMRLDELRAEQREHDDHEKEVATWGTKDHKPEDGE